MVVVTVSSWRCTKEKRNKYISVDYWLIRAILGQQKKVIVLRDLKKKKVLAANGNMMFFFLMSLFCFLYFCLSEELVTGIRGNKEIYTFEW